MRNLGILLSLATPLIKCKTKTKSSITTTTYTKCKMESSKPLGPESIASSAKREWRLEWEEYFMGIAFISAQRSKDPVCQVGACIINKDKRIVGIGYNGMPNNCPDDKFPWGKGNTAETSKHYYVCHAELNAITNKIQADIRGCTLYCTRFPCHECAKLIIQSGITKVVYGERSNKSDDQKEKASLKMFDAAKIEHVKYDPKRKVKLRVGDEQPYEL